MNCHVSVWDLLKFGPLSRHRWTDGQRRSSIALITIYLPDVFKTYDMFYDITL